MCDRQARLGGVSLPRLFWRLPEWSQAYRREVTAAQALLRRYPVTAVVAALKTQRGLRARTLAAPWLPALAGLEEQKLAQRPPVPKAPPTPPVVPAAWRPPQATRGTLDKLRELDGEEEDRGRGPGPYRVD